MGRRWSPITKDEPIRWHLLFLFFFFIFFSHPSTFHFLVGDSDRSRVTFSIFYNFFFQFRLLEFLRFFFVVVVVVVVVVDQGRPCVGLDRPAPANEQQLVAFWQR